MLLTHQSGVGTCKYSPEPYRWSRVSIAASQMSQKRSLSSSVEVSVRDRAGDVDNTLRVAATGGFNRPGRTGSAGWRWLRRRLLHSPRRWLTAITGINRHRRLPLHIRRIFTAVIAGNWTVVLKYSSILIARAGCPSGFLAEIAEIILPAEAFNIRIQIFFGQKRLRWGLPLPAAC